MDKKGMRKSVFIGSWTAVFAVILAGMVLLTSITSTYDSVITQFLGSVGGGIKASESGADPIYFKNDEDYSLAAQDALNKQIADEAVVLLRNEGGKLPITSSNPAVTLFGMAATGGTASGTGSGESAAVGGTLADSLKAAGFFVNEQVLEHYQTNSTAHGKGTAAGGGGDTGDWSLGREADFPTGVLADTFSSYPDAAIFVVARSGGEGGDLARTMDNHGGTHDQHYLQLSPSEEATLKGIKDSGAFDMIVVLVNSANPMELGFLEKYGVDACLWYAGLGANGIYSVGEVLAGKANPSGRLVDTYVYDNFTAPATQNLGDYRFLFDGALSDHSYTNYAETIYVGYRYYETRYEDTIMGTGNAGKFRYEDTVLYPFGYGQSYTSFAWDNYSAAVEDGMVKVSVDVTNNGPMAGKEVVQVYYQSEYTQYDRDNRIEKAAVNLAAFDKTGVIEPGATEHMEITFPLTDMKCYDAYGDYRTYILEAGEYYITAAKNAHDAVNNILAGKGYSNLVGNSDTALVQSYTQIETQVCDEAAHEDVKVTNWFDDAALDSSTYLSRSDWSSMDGGPASAVADVVGAGALTTATGQQTGSNTMGASGIMGIMEATETIRTAIVLEGYEASGNPIPIDSYVANRTYSEENGLELVDLRGVDYDAPEWDLLLNQMKFSEIYELFGHAGYGTIETTSINKPKTLEYDGPTGINSFVNDTKGYSFPNEISVAATWNLELVLDEGRMIGNDMVKMSEGEYKVSGWYAPAVNIHRTPFSGRNYEYYSEDPVLSGKMVAQVIQGVQAKGAYVYMKHYALNDQETNRSTNGQVATFSTEQAIREIYLKPFELGVREGGAKGIMTSMNRVGTCTAAGNYALITAVLRNEWGFQGAVITDYTSSLSAAAADQVLAAGGDLIMSSSWNAQQGVLSDFNAEWIRTLLRNAAHNVLYTQVNSLAMNGFVHGAVYDPGFPIYKIILIAAWMLTAAGIVAGGFFVYRTIPWTEAHWYSRKRISKKGWITIGCTAAAVIAVILIAFFTLVWPELSKALVM